MSSINSYSDYTSVDSGIAINLIPPSQRFATPTPPSRVLKFEGKFGGSILHTHVKKSQYTLLLASATPELLHILDENDRTPLHYAIEQGAPTDILLELIRLCPECVFVQDDAKETPLHIGCDFGISLVAVYAMLEADAATASRRNKQPILSIANANGKTPIMLIKAHNMKSEVVKDNNNNPFQQQQQQQGQQQQFQSFGIAMLNATKNLFTTHFTTLLPWKFHRDEYDNVLEALENAQAQPW